MADRVLPNVEHVYQNAVMDSTRWERFVPRDGDIVIATSYKAGTTWLQGICAALIFQAPEPPVPQDELSPWLDARFAPIDDVLAKIEGLAHRRYIKTHLPLDGLRFLSNLQYIFVGRDGLDVFMSLWNHWNNMRPEKIEELNNAPDRVGPQIPLPPDDLGRAFDDWLAKGSFDWEQDGYPFWSHLSHARSWWAYRRLDNILFVHFADLLADLDTEMRRIAAFLDEPVDAAIWPALCRAVTFDAMKANAERMAPGATAGMWKDTTNFFHRGSNRRWAGVLRAEQIGRYRELAAQRLAPGLARWLEHGRRGAGDPRTL